MSFNESQVTTVDPPVFQGGQVFLSWASTAPAGSLFQIYINGSKAYEGAKTSAWIAVPSSGVNRVDIGAILASDAGQDFSGSLPTPPKRRATLTWTGGTSLGADLDHFNIYGEGAPGAGISYSTPLATIAAFAGGSPVASGTYTWTSGTLTNGTWHYAIKPVDVAGNEGTVQTTSVTIAVPPGPPAKFTDGTRLHYTFSAGAVTLQWNAAESD